MRPEVRALLKREVLSYIPVTSISAGLRTTSEGGSRVPRSMAREKRGLHVMPDAA